MAGELHSRAAATAWLLLRNNEEADGDLSIPTIQSRVQTASGPVRFGLASDSAPRLLLPIHDRLQLYRRWKSDLLDVNAVRLSGDGKTGRFIDIVCKERSLEAAFAEVAQAILERIESGEAADKAGYDTLDDYRALFQMERDSGVDALLLRGLIGELVVLDQLSALHPNAVQLWLGPAGDRHDFRGGAVALEVKTSSPSSSASVHVSSFEQLVEPTGGELFLLQNVIEPTVGGKLSVSSLAKGIEQKLSRPNDFRDLLAAVGCDDPYSEKWNRSVFALEKQRVFRVVEGFPRLSFQHLVEKKLPPGVLSMSYDIDLTQAQGLELSTTDISDLKQRLVTCL